MTLIFLPPPLECWDYKPASPCLVLYDAGELTQGFGYTRETIHWLSYSSNLSENIYNFEAFLQSEARALNLDSTDVVQ